MKKLLLILVAFVCCLSLFTQDALLLYRQNYAKPLLIALKDITDITYKDAEQVMTLEQWNISSESETTVIDSLVFVDLETLDTNEYAHFVCPDDHHYKYYDRETYENIHIGDDISGTEYDVAHMNWGGSWRMPTIDQINELFDNCKWTLTTLNGVYGSLITGPNGATVFLPASGSRDEKGLHRKGTDGYYWSSSLYSTGEKYSYALYFNSYETEYCLPGRVDGCSVRPIVAPEKNKDDCHVAEAIDLGLPSGTRWASWNVGASAPEEYGGYYAWGETEEKDYYDMSTYKYYNGDYWDYVNIGDDIAGTEYDVAQVKWGGSWRMPSLDQIQELLDICTRTWTQQNDVNGTLITGPNGNSIFLPAAGYRWYDRLEDEGLFGSYRSSSVNSDYITAYILSFHLSDWGCYEGFRDYGFSVRAVCPSTPSDYISFADEAVKAICVANWDTNKDGEISYEEAAAVKSLGKVFYEKQGISSFNELLYFTGLTIIEEEAFRECSLTSVAIPASVKTIGEKAFMQCPNLSKVTLQKGVTWIDEEAFSACALTSITLPESLIRIGEQAFEENPLISVTLPRNVAYLGNSDEDDLYGGVFDYCYSLKEVNVDKSNETYASINGMLTTKDLKTLLFYPYAQGDSCEVPKGIEQIHCDAFNECKLSYVLLPSSFKSFIEEEGGYAAFNTCFDLRTVRVKMKVPFECSRYSFFGETYSSGTLFVPQGTKALYEKTAGWSRFQNIVEDDNDCPVAEAIDLGLPSGTKWASWNIGASAPEEYGGYYAWGETEEKSVYNDDTYIYCDGSWDTYHHIGEDIAGTEYDVAHVKWGGSWTMPSEEQTQELMDKCTWTWTTQNGVNGYLVAGPNGATIFLPAAGEHFDFESWGVGEKGSYWTSTHEKGIEHYAVSLYFHSNHIGWSSGSRDPGLPIRPIIATEKPNEDCPVAEAIDLGLPSGTKWASWNVGASAPEEYGGYYAWGETEEKDYYGWNTYMYGRNQDDCDHIGDDIAGTEYDVAHVKWGGKWTMPSRDQIKELCNNCTRIWTRQNGVNGTLVTGLNGNTIFLPAAGMGWEDFLNAKGNGGYYWSSTLLSYEEVMANELYLLSDRWGRTESFRFFGLSVRPVCP